MFWSDGELPGDQQRGEIFPALGFRNSNGLDRLGEHPVVAVCDPRGEFREFELLPGKIDLDVAINVIRLVGLLVAFGLEPGIPDLAILLLHSVEKVLKRDEQVSGDVLKGLGIRGLQEGEDLLVLLLGLVLLGS